MLRRMQPMLRIHLRRQLQDPATTAEQAAAIKRVLNTKLGIKLLGSKVEALAQSQHAGASLGSLPVGKLGDGKFLQWLWDNRQQIIDFIMMIVKLFSGA